jgi:hypothetical protein
MTATGSGTRFAFAQVDVVHSSRVGQACSRGSQRMAAVSKSAAGAALAELLAADGLASEEADDDGDRIGDDEAEKSPFLSRGSGVQ